MLYNDKRHEPFPTLATYLAADKVTRTWHKLKLGCERVMEECINTDQPARSGRVRVSFPTDDDGEEYTVVFIHGFTINLRPYEELQRTPLEIQVQPPWMYRRPVYLLT